MWKGNVYICSCTCHKKHIHSKGLYIHLYVIHTWIFIGLETCKWTIVCVSFRRFMWLLGSADPDIINDSTTIVTITIVKLAPLSQPMEVWYSSILAIRVSSTALSISAYLTESPWNNPTPRLITSKRWPSFVWRIKGDDHWFRFLHIFPCFVISISGDFLWAFPKRFFHGKSQVVPMGVPTFSEVKGLCHANPTERLPMKKGGHWGQPWLRKPSMTG